MIIEIEIDSPTNNNLLFHPLGKVIRGRFDLMRVEEPLARTKSFRAIPGQRIRVDTEAGVGSVIEPIHDDPSAMAMIQARGYSVAPSMQTFKAHVPTWLHWMKRAVDSGVARIVTGAMPDKIEGAKVFRPDVQDTRERLIEQIIAIAYGHLPDRVKKELAPVFAGL